MTPDQPTTEAKRQDAAWRAARARMKAAAVVQRPAPVKKAPTVRVQIMEATPEPTGIEVHDISIAAPVVVDRLAKLQIAHTNRGPLTIEDIIVLLAAVYKVEPIDLLSSRRDSSVTLPRQIGYYLSRKMTVHSLPTIGRAFNRDHTSILSGIRKIERLRARDPELDRDIRYLTAILKGNEMGTKNNPGKYDCYENAEADEPMFVLLGRDRLAAHLTSIWSKIRMGDWEAANADYHDMMRKHSLHYCIEPDVEKASEAMECSSAMFKFREERKKRETAKEDQP